MKFDKVFIVAAMAATVSGAAVPQKTPGDLHLPPKGYIWTQKGWVSPTEHNDAAEQEEANKLEPKSAQKTEPFIGIEVPEGVNPDEV